MKSEMKFNLRLQTGAQKVHVKKRFLGNFNMSFIYCRATANPLISTVVNKLMINYYSLCYFCEIAGHFGFYPPKNLSMNIQSKQILCG